MINQIHTRISLFEMEDDLKSFCIDLQWEGVPVDKVKFVNITFFFKLNILTRKGFVLLL